MNNENKINRDNNNEMEDEFNNSTDDNVCVYDTNNKKRSIHDYVTIKNENMYDWAVVDFINKEPCDTEYKQGNIHNVSIKDEIIDDLTVVISETELITDYTDNKVCLNKTAISRGYIKQELCGMKDEQGCMQNYPSIKDEKIDDLTVVVQDTELVTDCIDNKIYVHETIISGGSIKTEPCDTGDQSGSILNDVDMKACGECGDKYDLYCPKCPMLIRIFDSSDRNGTDNAVRRTLPKNFIDICETQSGLGIVALRAIPKGVVFGPFKGLDLTKDEPITKWKLKNKELDVAKDPEWLNWMQYVRTDKSSHQNLVPLQYEGRLYYRSECHINMGDELLVHWDGDSKEGEINNMEDSYWEPRVCENLNDSYACTFCCVGYKSISHLKAHNSTCTEKRNKKDFCKEIVQCDICKIYLDKKEYSDYHMNLCYGNNGKCVFNSRCKKNRGQRLHNGDRPFSCTLCPYKATTNSNLKQHIATHNCDKPFACTLCPYKTKTMPCLKLHIGIHNGDKPFACILCPYKAASKSNLRQHIAIHKSDKPFACTLCSYKTKTKSYLKKHIVIHNDDKAFACTHCPYKTMTKLNLKQHIAIHNDKQFACTLCPYKTTRKAILKEHMSVHNDDRPFACSLCPYKATTKSKLKQHIAIHNDGKPFACTLCPYKTMTNSNLKQHITNHNGDKPFVCTLCPYKTTTNSNLKQHIVSHNGNKPFACTLCPYKTIRKSILKQHIAIHNDDNPLACTFCPYKATTKSNLKQHIAVHNGDKPFACTLCPYKATRKWILKEHIAVHNDEKPFVCTLCSYRAKTKSYLKKHIAVHNGDNHRI